MTRIIIAISTFACIALLQNTQGNVKPLFSSRMIFEGTKRYPSSHGSTITELSDGTMLAAWYAGAAEKAKDVAILGVKFNTQTKKRSPFFVLHDTENFSDGNPVLYTDPWKRVWLFYVTIMGNSWNESSILYSLHYYSE